MCTLSVLCTLLLPVISGLVLFETNNYRLLYDGDRVGNAEYEYHAAQCRGMLNLKMSAVLYV